MQNAHLLFQIKMDSMEVTVGLKHISMISSNKCLVLSLSISRDRTKLDPLDRELLMLWLVNIVFSWNLLLIQFTHFN